ncbi:unnamed protein product [Brachionus calyciflorus]|uniref:Calponin-homology (CH) domain-containing protein n=1 Tax=Brachionus calyciflorus TaxID=104777 RepID=A0A813M4Y2_9BILA|nr:unnamed protein product [Brachionus calyciflorus]
MFKSDETNDIRPKRKIQCQRCTRKQAQINLTNRGLNKITKPKNENPISGSINYAHLISWYQSVRTDEKFLKSKNNQNFEETKEYVLWINRHLNENCSNIRIDNLFVYFDDSRKILYFLEILYKLGNDYLIKEKLNTRLHKIKNYQTCINFMEIDRKVKCVGISPIELANGNHKILLGLLFLIRHDYEYNFITKTTVKTPIKSSENLNCSKNSNNFFQNIIQSNHELINGSSENLDLVKSEFKLSKNSLDSDSKTSSSLIFDHDLNCSLERIISDQSSSPLISHSLNNIAQRGSTIFLNETRDNFDRSNLEFKSNSINFKDSFSNESQTDSIVELMNKINSASVGTLSDLTKHDFTKSLDSLNESEEMVNQNESEILKNQHSKDEKVDTVNVIEVKTEESCLSTDKINDDQSEKEKIIPEKDYNQIQEIETEQTNDSTHEEIIADNFEPKTESNIETLNDQVYQTESQVIDNPLEELKEMNEQFFDEVKESDVPNIDFINLNKTNEHTDGMPIDENMDSLVEVKNPESFVTELKEEINDKINTDYSVDFILIDETELNYMKVLDKENGLPLINSNLCSDDKEIEGEIQKEKSIIFDESKLNETEVLDQKNDLPLINSNLCSDEKEIESEIQEEKNIIFDENGFNETKVLDQENDLPLKSSSLCSDDKEVKDEIQDIIFSDESEKIYETEIFEETDSVKMVEKQIFEFESLPEESVSLENVDCFNAKELFVPVEEGAKNEKISLNDKEFDQIVPESTPAIHELSNNSEDNSLDQVIPSDDLILQENESLDNDSCSESIENSTVITEINDTLDEIQTEPLNNLDDKIDENNDEEQNENLNNSLEPILNDERLKNTDFNKSIENEVEEIPNDKKDEVSCDFKNDCNESLEEFQNTFEKVENGNLYFELKNSAQEPNELIDTNIANDLTQSKQIINETINEQLHDDQFLTSETNDSNSKMTYSKVVAEGIPLNIQNIPKPIAKSSPRNNHVKNDITFGSPKKKSNGKISYNKEHKITENQAKNLKIDSNLEIQKIADSVEPNSVKPSNYKTIENTNMVNNINQQVKKTIKNGNLEKKKSNQDTQVNKSLPKNGTENGKNNECHKNEKSFKNPKKSLLISNGNKNSESKEKIENKVDLLFSFLKGRTKYILCFAFLAIAYLVINENKIIFG